MGNQKYHHTDECIETLSPSFLHGLNYDYDPSRAYCDQLNMTFDEAGIDNADQIFHAAGLDQMQVDAVMALHIWRVKWLFTPINYTVIQRIKLALFFLFNRDPAQ